MNPQGLLEMLSAQRKNTGELVLEDVTYSKIFSHVWS